MPARKKKSSSSKSKAVVLLSAAGLGGLCAASLSPLADGTAALGHGSAGGADDAVRRQEVWSQERQHQERPLQTSRRRQRTSSSRTDKTTNVAGGADSVPERRIFNSFSLAEHEPSSYCGSLSLLPRGTPRDHERAGQGRVSAALPYDPAFDSNGEGDEYGESSTDEQLQRLQQQQLSEEEENAEFDAGGGPGGHYYYYPGRGRKAAQSLARNQDLGRFHTPPASPSSYRHRHQVSLFTGGTGSGSLYATSSGSGRGGGRRRAPGGMAASPFPTLSPAVVAAAGAAAGVLIKITAAAGLALAVLAPLVSALSSHWAYFLAGGICAAVSHTAAVPLDVIKTRIQCAPAGEEYRGTWDALVRICRSEGGQVLFCGAGATLVGYALQGSLKFGFFEFLKPVFSGLFRRGGAGGAPASAAAASTPFLGTLIAASVTAEIVGSSALTPLEAARIRMVADANYAPGLRAGIARMISEEGLGSLTRGLPAVLAKQVPYTVTKLVTFDYLVRTVASRLGSRGGGGGGAGGGGKSGVGAAGVGVTVACAIIAGVLSSLASQPGDSLLSALNSEGRKDPVAESGGRVRGSGFDVADVGSSEEFDEACSSEDQDGGGYPDFNASAAGRGGGDVVAREEVEPVIRAMRRIVGEIGVLGLFRGMGARMMHVTSIVTVQLLIYQSIKRMVGIES